MTLSSYFLGLSILLGSLVLFTVVFYAILCLGSRQQTRGLRPRNRKGSSYQQPSSLPARLAR